MTQRIRLATSHAKSTRPGRQGGFLGRHLAPRLLIGVLVLAVGFTVWKRGQIAEERAAHAAREVELQRSQEEAARRRAEEDRRRKEEAALQEAAAQQAAEAANPAMAAPAALGPVERKVVMASGVAALEKAKNNWDAALTRVETARQTELRDLLPALTKAREEFQTVTVPPCLVPPKTLMQEAMVEINKGYTLYMADAANRQFFLLPALDQGNKKMKEALRQVDECRTNAEFEYNAIKKEPAGNPPGT